MEPQRLPFAKAFDTPFISLDETSIEMGSLLFLFLAVMLISRVRWRRQLVRHLVQLASVVFFFFFVYSCLGVFGMIRNGLYGVSLIGTVYSESFYWLALPVVVVAVTLHSGPVFCGWICPTGTVQEASAMLGRLLPRRLRLRSRLRLVVLGIVLLAFTGLTIQVALDKRMFIEDSSLHWAAALLLLCYLVLIGVIDDLPTRRLRLLSVVAIVATAVSHVTITSPVHFAFTARDDPASALSTLVIALASLVVARSWCRYLCPWGWIWAFCTASPASRSFATTPRGHAMIVANAPPAATSARSIWRMVDASDPSIASSATPAWTRVRTGRIGSWTCGGSKRLRPILLILLANLAWISPARPAEPPDRSDWPTSRGDPQNLAAVRLDAPQSPAPRSWTFGGSGRVWGYQPGMSVWTSPAVGVVDGRALLVVGSYDKKLYALDAADGSLRWKFATGGGVYAAPVLWSPGDGETWVFATSSDRLLYALDARVGRRRWIHSVATYRPTIGGARLSSPCVGRVGARDAVFVGHHVWDRSLGQSLQEGGVTALDARSGGVLWRRVLGDNEMTDPVLIQPGVVGGQPPYSVDGEAMLLVGSSNGNLYALAAGPGSGGRILWQRTELDAIRSAPAVLPGSPTRIVLASKAGIVRCVDASDGAELWTYRTGDWVTGSPAIATIHERSVAIVGSYDRSLYAIDLLSGELVWRYFTRGGIHASPAVVGTDSGPLVLTSSWDHHLHGVDGYDGTGVWEVFTGRPLWSTVGLEHSHWASPAAARIRGEWMAFQGSYDGTFYAFRLAGLTAGGAAERRSSVGFWLSFPIALGAVAILAFVFTLRSRNRKRKRNRVRDRDGRHDGPRGASGSVR